MIIGIMYGYDRMNMDKNKAGVLSADLVDGVYV
jgi:hypothetical protein